MENTPGKYYYHEDMDLVDMYAKHDDREAMGELYQRYHHLVYGMAYKYLQNKVDADDLSMEVWTVVLKDVPKRNIISFKAWLYTTTKNLALNLIRKRAQESGKIDRFGKNVEKKFEKFMENDDSSCLYSSGKLKISEKDLNTAIEKLPEGQRECIHQFYIESYNYKEIAEHTGYQLKKVKSFLQNGKRNLKLFFTKNLEKS